MAIYNKNQPLFFGKRMKVKFTSQCMMHVFVKHEVRKQRGLSKSSKTCYLKCSNAGAGSSRQAALILIIIVMENRTVYCLNEFDGVSCKFAADP